MGGISLVGGELRARRKGGKGRVKRAPYIFCVVLGFSVSSKLDKTQSPSYQMWPKGPLLRAFPRPAGGQGNRAARSLLPLPPPAHQPLVLSHPPSPQHPQQESFLESQLGHIRRLAPFQGTPVGRPWKLKRRVETQAWLSFLSGSHLQSRW